MPYIIDSITAETINVNKTLVSSYYNNGNSSTNTNINWSNGNLQELNLDNDPTLTFSNGVVGQTSKLLLKQQLSGLRNITWSNDVIWNGGSAPTLQTVEGADTTDSTFNIGTGFNGNVIYKTISVQSDGKIIAGGDFTQYSGTNINRIIRISPTGEIDSTFVVGTGFNNRTSQTVIQPDGKIIVTGAFTQYSGVSFNRIVRLESNGSIDNTFIVGLGFSTTVSSVVLQSDGTMYVTGQFTSYNGTPANRIIKLNSTGGIDSTFNTGGGFNSTIIGTTVQPDGKIVVGGFFTSYNGTLINRIARLNTDGSIDTTFNVGTGFNERVYNIQIQNDGKIIAVGIFTQYNGKLANRIVRLNSDGSIDTTFNSGTGLNGYAVPIEIQNDGKILIGGVFTTYNGTPRDKIARLNIDGTLDTTFTGGLGFNLDVDAITVQTDQKILVGGVFTSYNGVTHNRIVRLNGIVPNDYNTIEFYYNGTYYIGSY